MNCQEVGDRLSAFHDGEILPHERDAVAEHVGHCEECRQHLHDLEQLSAMAAGVAQPVPPPNLWSAIETGMNEQQPVSIDSVPENQLYHRIRGPIVRWVGMALAASALVAVWIGVITRDVARHDRQVASVVGDICAACAGGGTAAKPLPPQVVHFEKADGAAVSELVGYRPLVADGVPEGYRVITTAVIKTPGCTCVQCSCRRSDGTTLTILEHDTQGKTWFGARPVSICKCGATDCQVTDVDGARVATWTTGDRALTVIGFRDTFELERLVAWFDDRRRNRVSELFERQQRF
jgi:anti-sigma factor RsiW